MVAILIGCPGQTSWMHFVMGRGRWGTQQRFKQEGPTPKSNTWLIQISYWWQISFPFRYLKKGTPFRQSLPIGSSIGSTAFPKNCCTVFIQLNAAVFIKFFHDLSAASIGGWHLFKSSARLFKMKYHLLLIIFLTLHLIAMHVIE